MNFDRPTSPRTPDAPWRVAVSSLALCAVLTVLAWRTVQLFGVDGALTFDQWAMADFRDAIHTPVVAWLRGDNPYDSAHYLEHYPVLQHFPLYAPHTLLVHAPFGLLSFPVASAVYFLVTVGLGVWFVELCLRACGRGRSWSEACFAATLLFASRPGHMNLVLGQSTLQLCIASFLALSWSRSKPWAAGAALAFAALKPTFGGPLLVLLWCAGARRACAWSVLWTVAATAVVLPGLIAGAGGLDPLITSLRENGNAFEASVFSSATESHGRVDAYSAVAKLIDVPAVTEHLLTLSVLAAVGLWIRRRHRSLEPTGLTGAVLLSTTTFGMYHQAYDLLLLAPTIIALAFAGSPLRRRLSTTVRRLWLGILTLLAANYATTATIIGRLELEDRPQLWTAVVLVNAGLLGLAWVLSLVAAQRNAAPHSAG